jgi:hypothetical protein
MERRRIFGEACAMRRCRTREFLQLVRVRVRVGVRVTVRARAIGLGLGLGLTTNPRHG